MISHIGQVVVSGIAILLAATVVILMYWPRHAKVAGILNGLRRRARMDEHAFLSHFTTREVENALYVRDLLSREIGVPVESIYPDDRVSSDLYLDIMCLDNLSREAFIITLERKTGSTVDWDFASSDFIVKELVKRLNG